MILFYNFRDIVCLKLNFSRESGRLQNVIFTNFSEKRPNPAKLTVIQHEIIAFLDSYEKSPNLSFSLLDFDNKSEFSISIYSALGNVPFGSTITYSQLAYKVGKPKAYRAVGNIMGKNPFPVIIPCHRVVGKHTLGGYSSGIDIKTKLLQYENHYIQNKKLATN